MLSNLKQRKSSLRFLVFSISLTVLSGCVFAAKEKKVLVSYLVYDNDYYVAEREGLRYHCFSDQALNQIVQTRVEELGR